MFRHNKAEKPRSFRLFIAYSLISVAFCTVTTACTTSNYMGISLKRGAAPAEIQRLAARAQAGDKRAQLDLGERFEAGRGVPADRARAIKLYRMAATDSGGMQMMYVPTSNGTSAIPVNTGSKRGGAMEARRRLNSMTAGGWIEEKALTPMNSPSGMNLVQDGHGPVVQGEAGRIFSVMVRLELFNGACLVRGRSISDKDLQHYPDEAWQCLMHASLPMDCKTYASAISKAVRVVRALPEFFVLQKAMPAVIEACVPAGVTASDAQSMDEEASLLDILLFEVGKANKVESARYARLKQSSEVHSNESYLPGSLFPTQMCLKLMAGEDVTEPGFWLLYCGEQQFGDRIRAADLIDKLLSERGLNGRAN